MLFVAETSWAEAVGMGIFFIALAWVIVTWIKHGD